MYLTTRWAERCLKAHTDTERQSLFGIVQGGTYGDLRKISARDLVAMDFPGYAIGGLSVGEPGPLMYEMLEETVPELPENKARYLMGVGSPDYLIEGAIRGIDMFDCVLPTRIGQKRDGHDVAGTSGRAGTPNTAGILPPWIRECDCPACPEFYPGVYPPPAEGGRDVWSSAGHAHNLYFLLNLMKSIRQAIMEDRLLDFRDEFFEKYGYLK